MKNLILTTVLPLVVGSFTLALTDPSVRPAFIDLTKVAVGAFIGLWIPSPDRKE